MDTFSRDERSAIMRRVQARDTKPEMLVRSLVHRMGLRFSAHRSDLPGKPDLVFPCRAKVIFVHGCFWHGHNCRSGRNRPSSNQDYWIPKLDRNMARDAANRRRLRREGWGVLTVWECELKNEPRLRGRIARFFGEPADSIGGVAASARRCVR
ncbi:MAG: DNA mismatch endonuclease Vsr [Acidobacteriia bacterium]|nr:DNA mismatch endonuclease Vsr [Terriglobia bacterium]